MARRKGREQKVLQFGLLCSDLWLIEDKFLLQSHSIQALPIDKSSEAIAIKIKATTTKVPAPNGVLYSPVQWKSASHLAELPI